MCYRQQIGLLKKPGCGILQNIQSNDMNLISGQGIQSRYQSKDIGMVFYQDNDTHAYKYFTGGQEDAVL